MSTVQEIEAAIQQLPREEIFHLREVLQHRFNDEWDKQFEGDVLSGRFDHLAEAAIAEHRAGKSTEFPLNEK
jgi:hypothetical protein